MARRTKVTAPSAAELQSLEDGFAAKPSDAAAGMMPPIAQVAAEAAALTPTETSATRVEAARDKRDAERLRQAEAEGLVLLEVPTASILADELTRDRIVMEPEAMEELKASIAMNGLRLPVEIFEIVESGDGPKFGLLSGFRRLAALRGLEADSGDARRYGKVKAILRQPGSVAGAFLAMVEENEIRADLTPYERGRVGVLAVQQGAFDSVEQAVNGLFHAASKAKRSKIRSFALVHEELGDMLSFPEHLSERAGLRPCGRVWRAGCGRRWPAGRASTPGRNGRLWSRWSRLPKRRSASRPGAGGPGAHRLHPGRRTGRVCTGWTMGSRSAARATARAITSAWKVAKSTRIWSIR